MNIFNSKKLFITGGLGFIGSNLINYLLNNGFEGEITIFDNNSIDNTPAVNKLRSYKNVKIIFGDLQLSELVNDAIKGSDMVIHLAANSDISKGVFNPSIDFKNTVLATQNLLSAMLVAGVSKIIFSSGSGVYGDVSDIFIPEDFGPLIPVSHYGASKLCAESMISSYVHMHNFQAVIFRFANVIGNGQTHGVAYDFIRKVLKNKETLEVLGDGSQLKSYIHVNDIIQGILVACQNTKRNIDYFNVSTDDAISVKDIALMVIEKMSMDSSIIFGKTPFGWKGDVPKIFLKNDKIKGLGWLPSMNTKEAMGIAITEMLYDIKYKMGN